MGSFLWSALAAVMCLALALAYYLGVRFGSSKSSLKVTDLQRLYDDEKKKVVGLEAENKRLKGEPTWSRLLDGDPSGYGGPHGP